MREAAEAPDHGLVLLGPLREALRLRKRLERLHAVDRVALVVEVLAVLERHVEEHSLARHELRLVAPRDRLAATLARVGILRERARIVAEEVSRELVEDDHEGQHRGRVASPGFDLAARGLGVQLAESVADLRVELFILAEPLRARRAAGFLRAEPEIEDFAGGRVEQLPRHGFVRPYGQSPWGQRFTSTDTCMSVGTHASRSR